MIKALNAYTSQKKLHIESIIHHYLAHLQKNTLYMFNYPNWGCDRTVYKNLYKYLNLKGKILVCLKNVEAVG